MACLLLPSVLHAQTADDTITVTAERLTALLDAFEGCREPACPPDERMRRALRAGDALFAAGSYAEARRILRAADVSDADAARFPVLAAGTRRALARVARHMGDVPTARNATAGIQRALRVGLPADDWRIAYARLE